MSVRRQKNFVYGMGDNLISVGPEPIVANQAPTTDDRVEIGTIWVDQPNDDAYILTSIVDGLATWINSGGGTGTFNALAVTTTATIGGNTTITTGDLEVTAGAVIIGALTPAGVVLNDISGTLSTATGTDGQILIDATAAGIPVWANITAGAGISVVNAANSITIAATGAVASSYTTDDANVVVPDGVGNVDVVGGLNIGTTGAIANTVTVNLDASPSVAGSLTAGVDFTMTSGVCTVTGTTDAAQTIYLRANAGVAETIEIHSDQGTLVNSIDIHSDVGGLSFESGLASADAINMAATNIAGGIDIDSGTEGLIVDTTGPVSLDGAAASNFTVTGAFDLTLDSTVGSVIVDGGEAVGDAVQLTASDAAGGITMAAGTGGITAGATNGAVAITSGTGAINIGVDAAAHTVTVGSTNTTARTVIQSGTGDVAVTSTDDITIDATDLFSIDGTVTSNVTVTGASEDLQLQAVGGAVVISGSEAVATAISLDASDGAGGVTIAAGTGGLLFGNQADCTTIDLGDFAPGANRTITVGGGTVIVAATTDTIDIGPDGATTNASSIKTVNVNTGGVALGEVLTNIASGAITSGTHTVSIQTGNAAAGTVATNVSTGTGTKIVNVGNADGLTTVNIDAITLINDSIDVATSINTGTSTGAVAIGNAAGGAMSIDTAAGISLDAATASNFTVTGAADLTLESTLGGVDIISALAAADAIVLNASDAAGGIDVDCGSAGFILEAANGEIRANSGTATVNISSDAAATIVNLGTGAGIKAVTVGSDNTSSITTVACGTLGLTLGTTANEHTTTIGSIVTASSVVCQSGTGIAAFGANATDHTTSLGSGTGTSATNISSGTGAMTVAALGIFDVDATGNITLDSSGGTVGMSEDAVAQNVNIATGAAAKVISIGNAIGATSVAIDSGTGDITATSTDDITLDATGDLSLDAAQIDINATAGDVTVTVATQTVAGVALTNSARVSQSTFSGQTTGAAADQVFTITNTFVTTANTVFVSVSNDGANDAQMSISRVKQLAGSIEITLTNNGAAALSGNVMISIWVMS